MTYLFLAIGLAFLVIGGELLVRGSVMVATKFNVSPLLIGLTLVGFGTSMPELVTSLEAAFADAPGIAVGNIVGSNIGNVLLIMGLAALIMPVAINKKSLKRDGTALAIATLLCLGAVLYGQLTLWMGIILVLGLAAYIFIAYKQERRQTAANDLLPDERAVRINIFPALVMVLLGLGLTIFGAKFLVQSAITIASALGISKTVIGLTVVAIGTSLPELVISVMAAMRGQSELAFGNVVGSNIYNILGILGVTAIVKPISIPPAIAQIDIWVLVATTIILLVVATTHKKISRLEGGLMILAYGAYVVSLILRTAS